jgi:hypothetical protein
LHLTRSTYGLISSVGGNINSDHGSLPIYFFDNLAYLFSDLQANFHSNPLESRFQVGAIYLPYQGDGYLYDVVIEVTNDFGAKSLGISLI